MLGYWNISLRYRFSLIGQGAQFSVTGANFEAVFSFLPD
jgi:hypothetical protein